LFEHVIQGVGQAQLGLALGGVGKSQISEHVSRATGEQRSPFSVSRAIAGTRCTGQLFQFWDIGQQKVAVSRTSKSP
jgi:hypothetical protein